MASDQDVVSVDREGLHVGDFVITPALTMATDDRLDTGQHRDRARQDDDDAQIAQHRAADTPPAPSSAALDASLEQARAALEGDVPDDLPILVHDPVTGASVVLSPSPSSEDRASLAPASSPDRAPA